MRISFAVTGFLAALFFSVTGFANAGVLITIDKSAQRMSVVVDGVPHYSWPVSTGRGGYDTPGGQYTPFRMEADHYSKEWDDAPMPHSIFFTKVGHAIHGTYDTAHLGGPASHGCVRLSTQNATTLFALVKAKGLPNTKVVLTGTAPPTAIARRGQPTRNAAPAPRQERQAYRDGYGYPSSYPPGYSYYPQRPAYAQPGYYGGQGYYDPRYQRRYPYGD
jgi:L,D-transpeptidase catalytic domain